MCCFSPKCLPSVAFLLLLLHAEACADVAALLVAAPGSRPLPMCLSATGLLRERAVDIYFSTPSASLRLANVLRSALFRASLPFNSGIFSDDG